MLSTMGLTRGFSDPGPGPRKQVSPSLALSHLGTLLSKVWEGGVRCRDRHKSTGQAWDHVGTDLDAGDLTDGLLVVGGQRVLALIWWK